MPWLPFEGNRYLAFVDAQIFFPGWSAAVLRVAEDVDMRLGKDPRAEYIYHFIVAGQQVFGYHRQPGHQWLDHRHDYLAGTMRGVTVTLKDVLSEIHSLRP